MSLESYKDTETENRKGMKDEFDRKDVFRRP
jgi:hypothetical protein